MRLQTTMSFFIGINTLKLECYNPIRLESLIMNKADFISREAEKAGAWSFIEYLYKLKELSNFNIGGIPLHLIAESSWFTPTNCELLSRWFDK